MMRTLSGLGAIGVRGTGAGDFLDAQFTQKVGDLAPGELRLAAWCTPQGRVRALLRVLRAPDGAFLLVLPLDLADGVRSALARFILRAPVSIDAAIARVFDASDCEPAELAALAHGTHRRDPSRRLAVSSGGAGDSTGTGGGAEAGGDATLDWRLADIRVGLPQVFAAGSGLWLPQNLDLEAIGGLSYSKGCYPGQEIVARLHYRGTLKQVLVRLQRVGGASPDLPGPGATLEPEPSPGQPVAQVVDAVAAAGGIPQALAVVDTVAATSTLSWHHGAGIFSHWQPIRPEAVADL